MYSYPNNICRNLNLLFPKVFLGQKNYNLQRGFALLNIMLIYAHTHINTKLKETHNKCLSTHYSNLLITHLLGSACNSSSMPKNIYKHLDSSQSVTCMPMMDCCCNFIMQLYYKLHNQYQFINRLYWTCQLNSEY